MSSELRTFISLNINKKGMGYYCNICKQGITKNEAKYSYDKYGKPLCRYHQQNAKQSQAFIDNDGYIREKIKHSNLVSRQIAYQQIYLKNKEKYPLKFIKYQVHHKDHNKLNNEISNLVLVTSEQHKEIHERSNAKENVTIHSKTHVGKVITWLLFILFFILLIFTILFFVLFSFNLKFIFLLFGMLFGIVCFIAFILLMVFLIFRGTYNWFGNRYYDITGFINSKKKN